MFILLNMSRIINILKPYASNFLNRFINGVGFGFGMGFAWLFTSRGQIKQ